MLKPKVGISACLLGRRVRYDGRDKFDPLPAEVLAGRIEWVPVCPEVESGLPVPREPIQLEGDPAAPELRGVRSHAELTGMMCAFCERRAAELDGLSGFVFKSRSPSCGLAVPVYGADGAAAGSAPGFFAAAWRKRYPGLPAVEAEALHDETCLWRFLAALQIEK